MSTPTLDAPSAQHESKAHSTQPGPQAALTPESLGPVGTVPSEAFGEALITPVMRNATNGSVRALVLRRTQQHGGNRSAQRLIAQMSRSGLVQRNCACGGTCSKCQEQSAATPVRDEMHLVQAKSNGMPAPDAITETTVRPTGSPGAPIDPQIRRSMESQLGADFRDVKIHTDPAAARAAGAIQANAYAIGSDIYFAEGKYQPESVEGRKLLVHELTHVKQQAAGQAPTQAMASPHGDVILGAPNDRLEQEAEQTAEAATLPERNPQSTPSKGPTPEEARVQRDGKDKAHADETVEDFKGRVMAHAISRLEKNIKSLDEWRAYVLTMKGFQLLAQMMSGNIFEYILTASSILGGGEKFESWAGTHDPGKRAYLESQLAPDATYREKANSYIEMLESKAYGYFATPSVAEQIQTFDKPEGQQAPQQPAVFVGPDPRYVHYKEAFDDIRTNKRGGCQKCHDVLLAEQQTIDEFGTKLPEPLEFKDMRTLTTQRFGPAFPNFGVAKPDAQALRTWLEPSTADLAAESARRRSAPMAPDLAAATQPEANQYIPDIPLPKSVEAPIPRTALCGPLPPASLEDTAYLAEAATWGPSSAVAAHFVARVGTVLRPLGPRGYRILPRETFQQLRHAGPKEIEGVRDTIVHNLDDRQQSYRKLQTKIAFGEVPYDELCPIVDELLPTTNEYVRTFVELDIAWKRAKEALLDKIMIIVGAALLLLAILFPPSIMLSAPILAAEAGLSLAGIAVGLRDLRRGKQYEQGRGAGVYSAAQEESADSLQLWGLVNIVTSLFGLLQVRAGLIAREARAAGAVGDLHPVVGEPVIEGEPRVVPGEGEGGGTGKIARDPDTTAKPGDFTTEQTNAANQKLAERVNNPKNVREVADPKLREKYDVEVDLGDGQIYRGRRDGTWCLFRNPTLCGTKMGSQVNQAVDAQKASLEAEAAAQAPKQAPAAADPAARLSQLRKNYKKILAEDSELQAKANLIERSPNLSATQRTKLLNELENDLIDRAVEHLESKLGKVANEKALRDYLRQHPEKIPDLLEADTGFKQENLPDPENRPPAVEPIAGGAGPGEAGLRGEELSLTRSRGLGETYRARQLEFQVQTPQGPVNTVADLGVRTPGGNPQLIESKFGPGAGYTDNQMRANGILPRQGGVPVNNAAIRYVREFYPNWQHGQAVVMPIRGEFWSIRGVLVRLEPW